MNRRNFINLTGTFTAGSLLLPDFLHALGNHVHSTAGNPCVVFVQLFGGNDGLNSFIPALDPLYYELRPAIAISKTESIALNGGMAFHPALKDFASLQQKGHLSVVQNVGYPEPVRSHFRSQEIWQTAPSKQEFLNSGWLGRYLDLQCQQHTPTAGINIDSIDNLALRGTELNSITIQNPEKFRSKDQNIHRKLSDNPQLDFVLKLADTLTEGADDIAKAMAASTAETAYPKTALGRNLGWIARLIKGNLNSKVYYTSQNGYDTHDNQLAIQKNKLGELNDAVFAFYNDLRAANLLQAVTIVVFSEFGRRVKDNGRGTDHGTAAPMFVIGGNNKGGIMGSNPDLFDLDAGDLKFKIDFRSVYATLLKEKLDFNPAKIGISQQPLSGLF